MVYIDFWKYKMFLFSSLALESAVVFAIFFFFKRNPAKKRKPKVEKSYKNFSIENAGEGKRRLNLKSLRFVGDASALMPEQEGVLDEMATALCSTDFADAKIRIIGHTCFTGRIDADGSSTRLSLERAQTVARELIKRNVSEKRLSCIGKGYSEPIVKNPLTNEQAALNRRVEIIIEP